MTVLHGISHTFDVGAEVEIMINTTFQGEVWRRGVIEKLAPYRGRPGYYVVYPDAKEQWECHGGWVFESLVRATKEATP